MTKLSKIILLAVIALLTTGLTFAYVVSQIRTNDQIIKIGGPDADGATLTALFDSSVVLVPMDVTTSSTNEVKLLQFSLTVDSDIPMNYHLDTDLPPEFQITTDREGYYYTTGITYTITLELLQQVDYSEYTFYLYVNFI